MNQLPKEQTVEKPPPLVVQVSSNVVGFPREFVHTVAMFFKEQSKLITEGTWHFYIYNSKRVEAERWVS